jgi:sarcosine oxidase, subunit delta
MRLLRRPLRIEDRVMLLIPCPHCGPRSELEFHCGGEAHIDRPTNPAATGDQRWAEYLFYRSNTKGVHAERWLHVHGCGRWFNVLRDTVSDRFVTADQSRPAEEGS